jgi:hypothetical protein
MTNLVLLGAGASKAAGYPLASDLLEALETDQSGRTVP